MRLRSRLGGNLATLVSNEIMRQPGQPQSKNGFGELFAQEKSPKVFVLEAGSSARWYGSINFAAKVSFSQI